MPAVLAVPLLNTTGFDLGEPVSDIDPTVTLHFRLSTFAEMFSSQSVSNILDIPCPSGIGYSRWCHQRAAARIQYFPDVASYLGYNGNPTRHYKR